MKIIGVTACPSGVAHTYMAAQALENACEAQDIKSKIETQGGIGIENELSHDDIKDADYVVLTKEVKIKGLERFDGKKVVMVGISDAVKKADSIVAKLVEHYNKTK